MADIPTTEPLQIRAGASIEWRRNDLSDYPASEWTLKYYLKNASNHIEISGTAVGDYHSITISAATSAGYTAGVYTWVAYAEKGSGQNIERHQVSEGAMEIFPSYANTTAFDGRSHVKTVLDAIEAAIEGRASRTDLSYTINGRTIQHMNPEELIKWDSHYKRLYQQELDAQKINQGLATGRKILTRFA